MYALLVKLEVQSKHLEEFMDAMLEDARHSLSDEPGCVRFDIIKADGNPCIIYLYEVYRDRNAYEKHTVSPHFLKWNDAIKDCLVAPPEIMRGTTFFPLDAAWCQQRL